METQHTTGSSSESRQKKAWVIGVVILGALLILGLVLWMLWQQQRERNAAEPVQISFTKEGLSPGTIKLNKGAVVTWVNQDSKTHRVVGDDANSIIDNEEDLANGDSYVVEFDLPGVYAYHDPLDPNNFKGTVIVE